VVKKDRKFESRLKEKNGPVLFGFDVAYVFGVASEEVV
jgi:hypothetical protein